MIGKLWSDKSLHVKIKKSITMKWSGANYRLCDIDVDTSGFGSITKHNRYIDAFNRSISEGFDGVMCL